MSQHTRGRHRAPSRLSSSVTTTARVSAAVAVSGGLIAAVTAPANATEAVGTLAMAKAAKQEPSKRTPSVPAAGSAVAHGVVQHGRVQLPAQEQARDLVRPTPRPAPEASGYQAQDSDRDAPQRSERPSRSSQRTNASSDRSSAPSSDRSSRSSSSSDDTSSGSTSSSGGSSDSSSTASSSNVVSIAKKYIGTPYKYGGSTPAGFDCSGFTGHVYQQVGISLPRSARAQQAAATRISTPRPGDLVFYNFPATHVMIYVGNGLVIDSPSPGKTVQVHKMWGSNISYGRVS